MGTKTIGLTDDAYERLKARKRDDESFTELVDRLLDDAQADWRERFGTLPDDEAAELEQLASESRSGTSSGLDDRQQNALQKLTDTEQDSNGD